jgi:ABC-2 type transport system permease protein
MNKMFAIFKVELKQFFYTPLAYFTAFGLNLINGVMFWYLVCKANMPGEGTPLEGNILTYLTGGVVFWLVILLLVPVLTMSLFAGEREKKTLPHLFSTPVETWAILSGKFLAVLIFYGVLWSPVLLYYFLLSFYHPMEFGILWSSLLGLILVGSFFLSLGMFVSAFSKTMIISAVMTFSFMVGIMMLTLFENLLENSFWKDIFQYMNYIDHFIPFTEGIINTRDVIYFLTGTLFFLTGTHEVLNFYRNQNAS